MTIAIIAAMKEEAAVFKSRLTDVQPIDIPLGGFWTGKHDGRETLLLQCGIGKANAAAAAAVLMDRFRPELIVHYGAAGGLDPELGVGDTVVATEVAYSDADATAFGYAYGQVPQMPARYPADPRIAELARAALADAGLPGTIKFGLVTTADSFISQPEKASLFRRLFPEARATDMEGAAIVQTAFRFGVPWVVVRSLSDLAGHEAADSFDSNLDLAAERSADAAELILRRYRAWAG